MKRNISKKFLYFFMTVILLSSCSLADNERKMIREGNKAYQDSIFDKAEVQYRKALDYNPTSFAANYNIANATYKQKNYKSAVSKYKRLLDSLETKEWRASANHNLGNSYLHSKEVDKAIAAYKEALRNNPDDKETKYNLVYAMNLKNQQQQQQNKQNKQQQEKQQQDKQQNKEQKEDKKSEQNSEPKDGDKEKKPQPKPNEDEDSQNNKDKGKEQKQNDKEKSEQDEKKEQQEKDGDKQKQNEKKDERGTPKEEKPDENGEKREIPVGISKEDAENILDAIAVEEKDAQEKVQKDKARKKGKVRKQKNW